MSNENKTPKKKKIALTRKILMSAGILAVLIVCSCLYFSSGRYISTDNAYIKATKILITPQVSGTIESVSITDNQKVKAGDVLFTIDPSNYEIGLEEAKADVANARTKIEQLKAQFRQKREDIARAQVDVDFAKKEYERRVVLVKKGTIAQSEFDESKRQYDTDEKTVASLKEDMNGILAELDGNPDIKAEDHPLYQKALGGLHDAELNLKRTTVKAPIDGIIGTAPHKGDFARAGIPVLNLVGSKDLWIEANYKETDLTHVKKGQPVSISIDTYPGHQWKGQVESISPATGSEFSVLPAQNATGNWVKVVQRIAVRISVEQGEGDILPLRSGMSTYVTIDIGHYPHALIHNAAADESENHG